MCFGNLNLGRIERDPRIHGSDTYRSDDNYGYFTRVQETVGFAIAAIGSLFANFSMEKRLLHPFCALAIPASGIILTVTAPHQYFGSLLKISGVALCILGLIGLGFFAVPGKIALGLFGLGSIALGLGSLWLGASYNRHMFGA